jgi:hypothetical protein
MSNEKKNEQIEPRAEKPSDEPAYELVARKGTAKDLQRETLEAFND